jgi:hypothetical protein
VIIPLGVVIDHKHSFASDLFRSKKTFVLLGISVLKLPWL